jgi:hypothetical protein
MVDSVSGYMSISVIRHPLQYTGKFTPEVSGNTSKSYIQTTLTLFSEPQFNR